MFSNMCIVASSVTAAAVTDKTQLISPGQNGLHFADDNFKGILMNEKFFISIRISLKFVLKSPIDNKATLVQVRAWHRTVDKPLPEPMLTQFTAAQ